MSIFNKDKLSLVMTLALSAIAFNHSAVMAEEKSQGVTITSELDAPVLKYDLDYMDDDVHVIIPKVLTEIKIKDGESLDYKHKYYAGKIQTPTMVARAFDDSVASKYKQNGFSVNYHNLLRSGVEIDQFLAFPIGTPASLDNFNKNFGKANFMDSLRTFGSNVAGVVLAVAGSSVVGSVGGSAEAGVSSLGRDSTGNFNIKNGKTAVFDGYQNLPAKADDNILIYGVATQGGKSTGKVIFITAKSEVEEDVIIRGIIKAQNISKIN